MDYQFAKDSLGQPYLKVKSSDYALLSNPLLNKGTAFPAEERELFNLTGLIPQHVTNLAIQKARSYETFLNKSSEIEKYIYLRDLQDSNETLFYSLLSEHIEELLPIVYTPVVGLGCQRFSHIYRRPRGLFISYPDRKSIDKILAHPRFDRVKVIVVSDGERILGLGDQGAGGMGIPIGKLALYTTCAGIYPGATLPILLDAGTNNLELRNDPLYIGWQHERIRGEAYDELIDAFVQGVKKRFPHVLVQWEDFAQQNANPILERYQQQICSFNDDIQGTAAVAAGTLFSAIHVTGVNLCDQRIVILGAGSAGCGISRLILQEMMNQGLSEVQAKKRFYLVDKLGLLTQDMAGLLSFQKPFAQASDVASTWSLEKPNFISLKDVVKNVHPTLLIGVSGQPGIISEDIVREMASHVERPIIFPLSNPTIRSEALPSDLLKWTDDRAVIGTGSPFGNVIKNGKPFRIDQTNNCYIFPGMGLGLIAVKASCVTDKMFMAAAKALAQSSPARLKRNANLLPPLAEIREVSFQVALAVATEAIAAGYSNYLPHTDLEEHIRNKMWTPAYLPFKKWV
jgi:malate dehydrogenase (oxaloacetate-decarboxylating)